jgi:hypothetical protein
MTSIQIPLFEEEKAELQGKIHCLKFDIRRDIAGLKDYFNRGGKFTATEVREETQHRLTLMLTRMDYYLEKWTDKKDLEIEQ